MMTKEKAANAVDFVFDMLKDPERVTSQKEMGDIHSALAPSLAEWVEECNGTRDVLMVSPVGSVNYDLLNESSDLDMKAIYMPNLSDFYNMHFPQFNFVTSVFDCQLSAAHKYVQFVLKGSMNHFEALFSPLCKAQPDFAYIMNKYLIPMVKMNDVANVRAAWFMALKAHSDAIKNGWKPKKAANAIRILVFLITYVEENRFSYIPSGVMKNTIMRLKSGSMDQEEFASVFNVLYETVAELAFDYYRGRSDYKIVKDVYDRDQSDSEEWATLKKGLDRAMMQLVVDQWDMS